MDNFKITKTTLKLTKALQDLIRKYEAGKRTLTAGLCWELLTVYKLPDSHSYALLDRYPETRQTECYSSLGDCGVFTEARYNFCKQLLVDVQEGKHDQFFLRKSI